MDSPLPPPAYGHGYPDAHRLDFVLLEKSTYLADRDNATTASCDLRGCGLEGSIKVTFCAAAPPHVSYVKPNLTVLTIEGPLVFLCAVLPCPSDIVHRRTREYFVYHAAGPSLEHLPSPGYLHTFVEASAALLRRCLRHGDGAASHDCDDACRGYVVVARRCASVARTPYELCLYHSETGAWTIKRTAPPGNAPYRHHVTHKAITIGGDRGMVAWVDLDLGIFLCDALAESPTVHGPGVGTGDPQCSRDVSIGGGSIRFTQLEGRNMEHAFQRRRPDLDSAKIYETKVQSDIGAAPRPTLRRLHTGLPVRSLRDDGIVYLLGKIDYQDNEQTAWVLAVDMETRTVQGVAEFGAGNAIGLGQAYIASDVSK
ncbi:hypothetical protein VPH35_132776 [Triticum aestivum]